MSRWLLLFALFCVGCPRPDVPPELPEPFAADTAVRLSTELDRAPAVTIRRLRGDVAVDCAQLQYLRGAVDPRAIEPALFDEGWSVQATAERGAAIRHREGAKCDLIRIEHARGQVALLMIQPGERHDLVVTDGGIGESYAIWPELGEGQQSQLERCAAVEGASIRWSEPVPVGKRLRVDAIEQTGECARLRLAGAFDWEICAGPVPLAVGDVVDVGVIDGALGTIRIERRSPRADVTIWLGDGPVMPQSGAASEPRLAFSRDTSCAITMRACGMVSVAARLDVTLGRRAVQLRGGERVMLQSDGGSLEVMVGAASFVPLAPSSCAAETSTASRFVAIQRRDESTPAVATEPAATMAP
jgi:hypothetical protein